MTDDAPRKPIACPHCNVPLDMATVARFAEQSTIVMRLHPKEGQLMAAETVGGMLTDIAKLNDAITRPHGVRCITMVKSMAVVDGALEFDLLLANGPRTRRKKKTHHTFIPKNLSLSTD